MFTCTCNYTVCTCTCMYNLQVVQSCAGCLSEVINKVSHDYKTVMGLFDKFYCKYIHVHVHVLTLY